MTDNVPVTECLLQQVLGTDWQALPPLIQRHYDLADGEENCLQGTMTIAYPDYMLPLIGLIHLFGGLVFRRGRDVPTRVQVSANAAGRLLNWRRTMSYPDGKKSYFRSQMTYYAEHELFESINYGLGLRLRVSADHGDLLYRSTGHHWQCGRFHLTLPDWLLLGTSTISEHVISDDEFYLDFTTRHPWWGETYSYRGNFRYCRD